MQSGRIDIAISSITVTDRRLESVAFVQPYYDSAQSLTVDSQSDIASLDGMRDKVVAVDTGSTGDIWTTANTSRYDFAEIRRFEGIVPAMLDVQSGRVDGYISDIPGLEYFIRDKPYFTVVQRIETGERYSMILARGNPLADQVNDVISELKRSGFVAQLHREWFGSEPLPDSSTVSVIDRPLSTSVGGTDAGFVQTFLNWEVLLNSYPLLLSRIERDTNAGCHQYRLRSNTGSVCCAGANVWHAVCQYCGEGLYRYLSLDTDPRAAYCCLLCTALCRH